MENVKKAVMYIGMPILFVLGFIYMLFMKINTLKGKLRDSEAGKIIQATNIQIDEAKSNADTQEQEFNSNYNDFKRLMDEYIKSRKSNS